MRAHKKVTLRKRKGENAFEEVGSEQYVDVAAIEATISLSLSNCEREHYS